jgi:hypothetical protein
VRQVCRHGHPFEDFHEAGHFHCVHI